MGKRRLEAKKTSSDIQSSVHEIMKRVLTFQNMSASEITNEQRVELKRHLQAFEISYNENPEAISQWRMFVNPIASCMALCGRKELLIGGIRNRRRMKFSGAEHFADAIEARVKELKAEEELRVTNEKQHTMDQASDKK
eukprot:GDKJ01035484.1.p1 GENE.GDKJ01035484.1~~GDKJ01035484.1.p1  ORF type:complete len:139 (-),score=16.80 GDKJ01035484.1:248-664(-)